MINPENKRSNQAPEADTLASLFPGFPKGRLAIIQEAAEVYRAFRRGKIPIDDFVKLLNDHGFLESADDQLGQLSPIKVIQEYIDQEPIKPSLIEFKSKKRPRKEKYQEFPSSPYLNWEIPSDINDFYYPIREPADVDTIPSSVRAVHLTDSSVVNVRVVKKLIKNVPEMTILQTSPSLFELMVGPKIISIIDRTPGLELRSGRIRDHPFYDEARPPQDYLEREIAYQTMLRDPERHAIFQKMLAYEMSAAVIGQAFFETGPISARHVARQLGLPVKKTSIDIVTFCCWLGISSDSETINARAAALAKRLSGWEKATTDQVEREKLRKKFAIGDQSPPETLAPRYWQEWHNISLLSTQNPQALDSLDKRQADLLIRYFQIGSFRGSHHSLRVLAEEYGCTQQNISYIINRALTKLNLLEDD